MPNQKVYSMDLHIVFLPFLAPGHMIPMLDMARLFAARGATATVVTTPANAALISVSVARAAAAGQPLRLLTLPFPSSDPALPENVSALPTPDITPAFSQAIDAIEAPFRRLLFDLRPDCIVTDVFYPWTADLAVELGLPRLVFHGINCFAPIAIGAISRAKPYESTGDEPFDVPGLPHAIRMTRAVLPEGVVNETDNVRRMSASHRRSYGMVMNTFYELEPEYAAMLKAGETKAWHVGPVSLCSEDALDKTVRGETPAADADRCLRWLDGQKPVSVLFVCFGSLGRFTPAQLDEIAAGLEAAGRPFVWALKKDGGPWRSEGLERRVVEEGKGFITRGWAPQTLILAHRAVGGFLTHCGWNSSLEAISAGVPMITWPLFAEQPFNERLIVDVLRVGVAVGVKACAAREEERGTVTAEEVRRAVEELMGGGEDAEARRRRAAELAAMAKRAVEEGGSSYNDLSRLIDELVELKSTQSRNKTQKE